jgi:hypothetical protein
MGSEPSGPAGDLSLQASATYRAGAAAVRRQQHACAGFAIAGTLDLYDRGENIVIGRSFNFAPQRQNAFEIGHASILAQEEGFRLP